MNRPPRRWLRAAAAATLFAGLMTASPRPAAAAPPAAAVFARESYWDGFADFWVGRLKRQDGIVMVALGVGVVSLFIITRGKWKK
jgi:hypothetical protein